MNQRKSNPFTLIELMVVIAVIAVIAAILLPALQRAKGAALTAECISNERQFLLAVRLYSDDTQIILPHQQGNLNPDGMLMPFWWDMTDGGGYIADKEILLCPTAPVHDYPFKYKPSTNAYEKGAAYWKRFWNPSPANISSEASWQNTSYNNAMGTYYYWGGAAHRVSPNSRQWECWATHKDSPFRRHFTMKDSHVGDPSQYAIIWDQDMWRNYLHGRPEQMPHMRYRQGRSFGFFDGHVEFHPLNTFDDASFMTPILLSEGTVMYRGVNYRHDSYSAKNVDGILNLPVLY